MKSGWWTWRWSNFSIAGRSALPHHASMKQFSLLALAFLVNSVAVSRGEAAAEQAPTGLDLIGVLQPARLARVGGGLSGTVVKVLVQEGDQVRAGDLLAQLDDTRAKGEFEVARADLELAQARLQGAAAAAAGAGKEQIAVAQAEVRRAQAVLMLAEHKLAQTRIIAPLGGTILRRAVEAGSAVGSAGRESPWLFEMADLRELVVEVSVAETLRRRVQKGEEARISVPAQPGVTFAGEVTHIAPVVDQATGSFRVRVSVKSAAQGEALMPGMHARVSLLGKE
jgi:RND family efflux transporter MFP subunit